MTVEKALAIDRETNTTFWHDAIKKEMIAFHFLEPNAKSPVGLKWIKCHKVFDVKMDFIRKAQYVAGGYMTNPPTSLTNSSVVSRDSVRIVFLLVTLNDIDILAAHLGNAYLNAPTKEKVYISAGPEFGPELKGRPTLYTMGFTSSLSDPDVWFYPAVKPNDFQYYEDV
jgi:hypothetical protein